MHDRCPVRPSTENRSSPRPDLKEFSEQPAKSPPVRDVSLRSAASLAGRPPVPVAWSACRITTPPPELRPVPDSPAPEWVRDAVFYQIFPDRFAKSLSVPKPQGIDAWGSTPTYHGYQGRRPRRRDRATRLPSGPRRDGHLLHPDLPVRLEPPLPHPRLPPRGPDARRGRGAQAAARRGPRSGHEGRARRRVQPRQPRFLPVPRPPRKWVELRLPRLVPRQPVPALRLRFGPLAELRRVVGSARAAQV